MKAPATVTTLHTEATTQTPAARIYRHDFDSKGEPDPSPLMLANEPPPWRKFARKREALAEGQAKLTARSMESDQEERGRHYLIDEKEAALVNAALVLRRPLLITGQAGIGKTTLAYSVAWQLGLGNVLRWGVTSRSTLKDALYHYDALARLHEISLNKQVESEAGSRVMPDFGDYFTLGPLGTALLPTSSHGYQPRVLLIDEIDKSDADLPSDLLHVLEEGSFYIPEIDRLPEAQKPGGKLSVKSADPATAKVDVPADGRIRCDDFPLIIMTSNGDRDFPPAFLRRCLQLSIPWDRRKAQLKAILRRHLHEDADTEDAEKLIEHFSAEREKLDATLAIDQLLNAIFLSRARADVNPIKHEEIKEAVFRSLSEMPQAPQS